MWKPWNQSPSADPRSGAPSGVAPSSVPASVGNQPPVNQVLVESLRRMQLRLSHHGSDLASGQYQSRFRGQGLEFSEVREYVPGDDIRSIDWNVTARTGRPHVKIFREERELTLYLILDCSRSMFVGRSATSKWELAVQMAAALAYLGIHMHDRVGLIGFHHENPILLPAKKGRAQYLALLQALIAPQANPGSQSLLQPALEAFNRLCLRSSVVILLSDFLFPPPEGSLAQIANRHDLRFLRLLDSSPKETTNPGFAMVQDAESQQSRLIFGGKTLQREMAHGMLWHDSWLPLMRKWGSPVADFSVDVDPFHQLVAFLRSTSGATSRAIPRRQGNRS
jgi:uncharacterized protein (DUF58 family)